MDLAGLSRRHEAKWRHHNMPANTCHFVQRDWGDIEKHLRVCAHLPGSPQSALVERPQSLAAGAPASPERLPGNASPSPSTCAERCSGGTCIFRSWCGMLAEVCSKTTCSQQLDANFLTPVSHRIMLILITIKMLNGKLIIEPPPVQSASAMQAALK